MRNKTPDFMEVRWEVLKSMLNDFPQLQDRTVHYLLSNRNPVKENATDQEAGIRELVQKAVDECRCERSRK